MQVVFLTRGRASMAKARRSGGLHAASESLREMRVRLQKPVEVQ
jgi:hypothetical protein